MSLPETELPKPDRYVVRRLTIITFSVVLVVMIIHLLKQLEDILQPLLLAVLISYAILPPHRWLVRRGVRPGLSYVLLTVLVLALFIFAVQGAYRSVVALTENKEQLDRYRARINGLQDSAVRALQSAGVTNASEQLQIARSRLTQSQEQVLTGLQRAASGFMGFLGFALIVFIYLVFLVIEKITFDRRMTLAFGEVRAGRIAQIMLSINEAIMNYIAVKMWISLVTALMCLAVYLIFGIEFAFFWALLIFVLNFIPYIGGLVAMGPPVILGFLQHESLWPGVVIIILLIGIQLFTGQIVEPRVAGNRLNLSPLLILLSLAFWGYLWGIPGMLLAVPLTVVIKIVLDHIPETRPIGTLMSNL